MTSRQYLHRAIEPILRKAAKQFPAIVLTGPRQAGKTTVLKKLFGKSHRYVSLEPPDIRAAASSDPRGFLQLNAPPVIFDEIQYAPDLLFYIKELIDAKRHTYGQYLLTGSQNLLFLGKVTESLAGRTAILKLLPFSYQEMQGHPSTDFFWEKKKTQKILPLRDFWKLMLRGGYPELTQHPKKDSTLWQGSYVQTYLERDVRALRQIGDLTQFQMFLRALAVRSCQLLHLSDLAKDIGIAVNTAKAWIAILEASFQILILRPYFTNLGKRLVKAPKIYFTDVGTLCYLTGIKEIEHAISSPLTGPIVETAIVTEVYKRLISRGVEPQISFWRTAAGEEVDLIVEDQSKLIPIEIKASATPTSKMAKGILEFQKSVGAKVTRGYVVYPGELELPLAHSVSALPFSLL